MQPHQMAAIVHIENAILEAVTLCGMVIRGADANEVFAKAGDCYRMQTLAAGPLEKLKKDLSQMAVELASFDAVRGKEVQ